MSLYADVFQALDRADVRYVVVGGVAVVLRGHARLTVDLDLDLDLAHDNALRAVDALLGCGLQPRLPVDAHEFAEIDMKRAAGRPKDLEDVVALERLLAP